MVTGTRGGGKGGNGGKGETFGSGISVVIFIPVESVVFMTGGSPSAMLLSSILILDEVLASVCAV